MESNEKSELRKNFTKLTHKKRNITNSANSNNNSNNNISSSGDINSREE